MHARTFEHLTATLGYARHFFARRRDKLRNPHRKNVRHRYVDLLLLNISNEAGKIERGKNEMWKTAMKNKIERSRCKKQVLFTIMDLLWS